MSLVGFFFFFFFFFFLFFYFFSKGVETPSLLCLEFNTCEGWMKVCLYTGGQGRQFGGGGGACRSVDILPFSQ